MSELINNSETRKAELKEIIKNLNTADDHAKAKKQMQKRFSALLKDLSPEEIAEAEQALIGEGMAVEEVQKLCEIHVDAFESTLKKNAGRDRQAARLARLSGHPIATYRAENRALRNELRTLLREISAWKNDADTARARKVQAAFDSVALVETHYARKENQLFPYLESAGFSGPSKVMWGKHDEIRVVLRQLRSDIAANDADSARQTVKLLARSLKRMVFMEEKILFPTAVRKLPEPVWISIRRGESAIGYAWIKPGNLWDPNVATSSGGYTAASGESANTTTAASASGVSIGKDNPWRKDPEQVATPVHATGGIELATGNLTAEQLNLMLTNLPVDVSFVDENDIVRYYSDNPERIFPRSPGVIGRSVQNCHPPSSVHVVQKIVDDFKARRRTEAEFWIQMRGKFIHIRYFPMWSGDTFRGVLEVSQDVTGIRALEGEKRLLDE